MKKKYHGKDLKIFHSSQNKIEGLFTLRNKFFISNQVTKVVVVSPVLNSSPEVVSLCINYFHTNEGAGGKAREKQEVVLKSALISENPQK